MIPNKSAGEWALMTVTAIIAIGFPWIALSIIEILLSYGVLEQ